MKRCTRIGIIMLLAALAVGSMTARAADIAPPAVRVTRWQPHDFAFQADDKLDNPFDVSFAGGATGPGGIRLALPGFYDGDGTWKLRFAPTVEGEWSILTRSTLSGLDHRRASVVCIANPSPLAHGGLGIDAQHPRHFVFADGARYLPVGYECDWLWALDANDPELKTVNAFLDKLAGSGFNYILLNAYAYDTSWRTGKMAEDDFGPPPLCAWEGSNLKPDHSRLNLAYWQHYDRIIDALYRRGLVAHIMIKVYNKMVQWPALGSAEDDLYFRWLIARYAAYPNVNWDFSKEANNEKSLEYKVDRLKFIRANDPYRRLVTVHDDRATYNRAAYDKLLDYRTDQQHSKWHATLLDHRRQHVWPVINAEFGYEYGPTGPSDKTYRVVQSPEEVCRRAWEVYMAGGYGVYYYTYTAWDVIRPADTPPGYAYFKNLREFFEGTGYWLMEPRDDLVSDGYCLANPGKEYIVFQNTAKPFTLKLEGPAAPLKAQWYQPLSGQRRDTGAQASGTAQWTPPQDWGQGPVVLHVGSPGPLVTVK